MSPTADIATADAPPSADIERIAVSLGTRSYDIVIGSDLLRRAGELSRPVMPRERAVIVTDSNVDPLYGEALAASLEEAGIRQSVITVPAGEASKDFRTLERLSEEVLSLGAERNDTIFALGGGVVGDLAGFASAILLRGTRYIQVPTSLLAQVDSSVGGKTAINAAQGKNLIGAFHQPTLVLADTGVLDTLPPRELRAGYAEMVKYGLLGDAEFFAWLEASGAAVLDGDAAARRYAIRRCCEIKAEVVAEDERESGVRALLNLGHTFAHALEAEAGYEGRLLHGEAVAVGMVLAFELSVRLNLCPPADAVRARAHLASAGLPTAVSEISLPDQTDMADRLIAHMWKDKKVADGRLTFVLTRGIGDAFTTSDVAVEDVMALLSPSNAA